jgi:hypothetical protein
VVVVHTIIIIIIINDKAIAVTGLGDLEECGMLRIPHCLDNRLRDGSEVVGLARLPRFTPQKHFLVLIYVIG